MNVFQVFTDALASTPYPMTQIPVKGDAPVYLAIFEVVGNFSSYASNEPQRITHTMQVDIYGRKAIGPELPIVREALKAAGIRVGSWGPADYERDTGWHHLPITCYYAERYEQEENNHG